ncbi:MAG: hypothetical protein R3C59_11130 [Planctomycetaceae bacterium]
MSEIESPPTTTHHDDRTELEKLLFRLKPWLQENGTTLIYALAAVLAIAAVVIYARRTPPGNAEASRALLLAVTPEDFRDVADEYPDTHIGSWSRLRQADRLLDNAVSNLFSNRAVGLEEMDQAEAAYQRLADRTSLDEQIRERVLIGLARVTENRSDGTEAASRKAIAAWQLVLDEFPSTIIKEHAEQRIKELATKESQEFYAWFHKQDPKPLPVGQPDVPAIPGGLSIPGMSEDAGDVGPVEATVPEEPSDAAKPEAAEAKPAEPAQPATEEKKATEGKPTEEKPAAEKPAAEKPAAEEKASEAEPAGAAKSESETKPADEAPQDAPAEAPADPAAEKDGK